MPASPSPRSAAGGSDSQTRPTSRSGSALLGVRHVAPGWGKPHGRCTTSWTSCTRTRPDPDESRTPASGGPLLALCVERHSVPDQLLQGLLVDLVGFLDVNGAPHLALEARVEQPGGIVQRSALEERQLDHVLV